MVFAALDIVYAARLATVDPGERGFYSWLHECAPLRLWAVPWLLVAVMCAHGALRTTCDKAAFAAAIGIKVLWSCLYLSGWLLGDVPEGWVSASVWAAFAACVWLIAGWPEPINGKGRPPWTPPLG
ncbi:hypothetical protein [Micromonospora sp. NPDC049891]|uniref:hypothetical protein n=1 Tax=Micromonospora sp. NPDC049891 TaxID=3155655 RepID=UPI0033E8456A